MGVSLSAGGINDDMLESRRVGQQRPGSPVFPRPGRVISQRGASLTRSSRGEHKHQNTHTDVRRSLPGPDPSLSAQLAELSAAA